jgi:hypothetical protein
MRLRDLQQIFFVHEIKGIIGGKSGQFQAILTVNCKNH